MRRASECTLAEGFGTAEKAWAQVSFLAMGTLGTVGIALENWPWIFPLLIAFLIAAVAWYAGQFSYFCRRCRVFDCPFNRVPVARRTS